MVLLALDTAQDATQVALVDATGGVLGRASEPMATGHAEALVPLVATTLADAGLAHADITKIAVDIGPGTFTGVRIALSAARALALALGVPAVGVGSLEALAEEAGPVQDLVAIVDARRSEVYVQDFSRGEALGEPELIAVDALAARHLRPRVAIGSGAPLLAAHVPGLAVIHDRPFPDILAIARIGLARPAGAAPRPHYIRAPDAKPQATRLPMAGTA
jgi:tRNA threonylcarbamoyladenosine biosynthesis protein TsaB